jgi:hypothetical protein
MSSGGHDLACVPAALAGQARPQLFLPELYGGDTEACISSRRRLVCRQLNRNAS